MIRMFPPAVREKILAQDFDLFAATTRLEIALEESELAAAGLDPDPGNAAKPG